ncbi:DGQHR domain-containing protein [Bradyrhizobium sp. Ce-3]|uniref:DGQHR domain-containing protein n=1 Tax=Bradyrhizobium sp. Ce-3 TaxID=2913970 RepID=UPI001FC8C4E2|nr:DGQHR domain-containing protein [Bradyrhizobium sp. Ce-3]GKQ55997.1 DGQHR domain-containing protein [Bradyrhizobium sp. Ce-3]
MENLVIPVFSIKQPIGDFYVGVIRADDLLRICRFDYRRMQYENEYADYLGIQRKLNKNRIADIKKYVGTLDACFPTSIVISIDQKCAEIQETERQDFLLLKVSDYTDTEAPQLSIALDQVATIIDGQHRLKGLEEAGKAGFELPISIFIGADEATEASIFSIVNLAQTKVNKSLAYDLFEYAKTRSPEKTCHEIVVALDKLEESPFHNQIKRLGVRTENRFGETLSQATIVKGLLPYISKDPLLDRDAGKRYGFWEPALASANSKRIFYEFFRRDEDERILQIVMNYFTAVSERWSKAWEGSGKGNIIKRTNGFNGFIRFLRPAYLHFTTKPQLVTKTEFAELFADVKLDDSDFNPTRFLPGSSGATELYKTLLKDTGVQS